MGTTECIHCGGQIADIVGTSCPHCGGVSTYQSIPIYPSAIPIYTLHDFCNLHDTVSSHHGCRFHFVIPRALFSI